jgi:AcrR family transcriptional regulator
MNVHSQPASAPPRTGPEAPRAAILDAALELFCERGFAGTAVPALARAAGIAAGTVYRHFTGKDELVNALYCQHKTALMTSLLDAFPFDAAPREQFRAFWLRLTRVARAQPRAFRVLELHHHAGYLNADSRALEAASLRPVGDYLDRTAAAGITRPMPAAAIAAIVWGAFVGLIKAEAQGYLTLTDTLNAQAEQACWNAIAADGSPDGGHPPRKRKGDSR